ncbi:MAG: hypothetical protein HC819_11530 [Cyclobacteriaceae bacterium]|nr:hypothetical protein [Cyclobacteriaceae bacterium]
MESNINHLVISSYSKNFSERLVSNYFTNKSSIKGTEITTFTEVKQVNFFILKILFEKWSDEIDRLESPYFDYSTDEVQKALNTFMNVLSKNIQVKKEDLKPLLEEATYKTLLLIFSPYEFYLQEIDKPGTNQISLADLESIKKYIKINDHLLQAYIDRFKGDGIQAVFNEDAIRIFDEVCETIRETPEDLDNYLQMFSRVIPLDLNRVYSEQSQPHRVAKTQEVDILNEKLGTKTQTLLDTLGTEKRKRL